MKVLVTGGTGMVGRNITEHRKARVHQIFAPRRAELDLFDSNAVVDYVRKLKPDIVVHSAGRVGGIQANIRSPVAFLVENVDIGRNVILAAHKAGVHRLLNLGSSCMYPRRAANPLTEDMILTGELEPTNEGYALGKVFAQRLCEYISRESADFTYKTLIPCNLYGCYDKFDPAVSHLIPAILRKMHEAVRSGSEAVEIWGTGEVRREFMYAEDLADCIWECVDRFDQVPPVMNVGLGLDYSINQYYETARAITGFTGRFIHDLNRPVGMNQKLVAIERLRKFGWTAAFSLDAGMRKTYEYFLSHMEGK